PAAFVWAIYEMEARLEAAAAAVAKGEDKYPVRLPYGIAVAPKGAGFYGEGTNLAHNLPLGGNPSRDVEALEHFNDGARRLWVPASDLKKQIAKLNHHESASRPKEREHPLAARDVQLHRVPALASKPVPKNRLDSSSWKRFSPMEAVDAMFLATVKANPHLRPRVGNPDEMKSNRLIKTLEALNFRVTEPEPGIPENVHGAVITALNEEAVASAALANKGGINLIHTYEAFGTKMQGVVRQELIFASHCNEVGMCRQNWLSVPLMLTSGVWENSKNELSHQDPSMAEAMLGELSDVSRVLFPADYNSAAVLTRAVYQTHRQIWTVALAKYEAIPSLFTPDECMQMMGQGALHLDWAGYKTEKANLILTAIGGYQLEQALKASNRLSERDIPHSVVYMLEPGRFRTPRSEGEREHAVPEDFRNLMYPPSVPDRIFIVHTRPEPMLGVLQPLNTGPSHTACLGFIGRGGTLTPDGMLYINRCTWAHILMESAHLLKIPATKLLTRKEIAALEGKANPEGVII
ncbi:MAG: xylulose 5-phosphate 3-epimerase, partial [Dehalococcoidia bacterium]